MTSTVHETFLKWWQFINDMLFINDKQIYILNAIVKKS